MKVFIIRFFSLATIFIIAFNIFSYSAFAYPQINDLTTDEINTLVDKHENFTISNNGNDMTFIYYNDGWICFELATDINNHGVFRSDDTLKNYLSGTEKYNTISVNTLNNLVQIGLGFVTKNPYPIFNGLMNELTFDEQSNLLENHITTDTNGNINIDSVFIEEIKNEIEKAYLTNNGMIELAGNEKAFMSQIEDIAGQASYPDDKTNMYNYADEYNLMFREDYQYESCFFIDTSNVFYYFFNNQSHVHTNGSTYTNNCLMFADKEGNTLNTPDLSVCKYVNDGGEYTLTGSFYGTTFTYTLFNIRYNSNGSPSYFQNWWIWDRMDSYQTCNLYHKKTIYVFENYEKLYDYIHGDGTYIASRFYETQTALQITANQLAEDTNAKLQQIYETIKSGSASVATSDELQQLIDDTLDSIDKVVDNTEEINNKLDKLIELIKTQNETLTDLLGVTESINTSVKNIELMTAIDLATNMNDQYKVVADSAKSKFPFSVPYDIYAIFSVMAADPVAPRFECNYSAVFGPILTNSNAPPDDTYTFVIDFEWAQPLSDISRGFLSLLFISYLVTLTRKMFFNGGKMT